MVEEGGFEYLPLENKTISHSRLHGGVFGNRLLSSSVFGNPLPTDS